jgi:hypothetical protein
MPLIIIGLLFNGAVSIETVAADDWMVNECGEVCGMRIGGGNSLNALCPQRITYNLIWDLARDEKHGQMQE